MRDNRAQDAVRHVAAGSRASQTSVERTLETWIDPDPDMVAAGARVLKERLGIDPKYGKGIIEEVWQEMFREGWQ